MAIVTVPPFTIPRMWGTSGSGALSGQVLANAGEKHSFKIEVPANGDITDVDFLIQAFTSAGDLDVGLETVGGADGHPTGTQYKGSAVGTINIAAAGQKTKTLATPAVGAAMGDDIFVHFTRQGGNYVIGHTGSAINFLPSQGERFIYRDFFNATVWAKGASNVPILGLRYGSTRYWVGCLYSNNASAALSFNSSSSPYAEVGIRFTVLAPKRVRGFTVFGSFQENAEINLYEGTSHTPMPGMTRTIDKDYFAIALTQPGHHRFLFPAKATLVPGTVYRLALKPLTVTNIQLFELKVDANADLGFMETGTSWYRTAWHGTNLTWDDVNTTLPMIGIDVDGIDDGAAGVGIDKWSSGMDSVQMSRQLVTI